jgi:hypothetical protein
MKVRKKSEAWGSLSASRVGILLRVLPRLPMAAMRPEAIVVIRKPWMTQKIQ